LTHPTPRPPIAEKVLIVGEGKGDCAFFKYLCADRNIVGVEFDEAGGTGKFESYLKALPSRSGFGRLLGLIVAVDCDDGPDAALAEARRSIKKAGLPYPDNHLQIKRNNDSPLKVSIMMIPFSDNGPIRGCLETLLLQSAVEHLPISRCIEDHCECVATRDWPKISSVHKFKLRSLLAAAWPDDPNIGLQYAVSPSKNLIPLGNRCFDTIAVAIESLKNDMIA
jgi:hypothetical protein